MNDISMKIEPKVLIGSDVVNRLASLTLEFGDRALLVMEQALCDTPLGDRVKKILDLGNIETLIYDEVYSAAHAESSDIIAELARAARCDVIIAFGGAKTQQIARFASLLVKEKNHLFELIDKKESMVTGLPYIAVPSSGRDPFFFTDYFICVDPRDRFVRYLHAPNALCKAVLIDPLLSYSSSKKHLASTLFDGLCVSIEAYCSSKSNFLSEALAERAIRMYAESIESFQLTKTADIEKTLQADFLAALSASLSAPGLVTALAHSISAKYSVEKSWCSTVLLPYLMELYLSARPEKIAFVAKAFEEKVEGAATVDSAHLAIEAVRRRMGMLELPARLKDLGLELDRMAALAEQSRNLDFVAFSPRPLSDDDVFNVLKQAF